MRQDILLLGKPDQGGLGIGLVVGQGLRHPVQRQVVQRRHPGSDGAIARRDKFEGLVNALAMPVNDERQWRRISSGRSAAAVIAMSASAKLGSKAMGFSVMGIGSFQPR